MTAARFEELALHYAKEPDRMIAPLHNQDTATRIRSIGFGPAEGVGLFADLDGDRVTAIWCNPWTHIEWQTITVAFMLHALPADQHLMLVDWQQCLHIDLRDVEDIDGYLDPLQALSSETGAGPSFMSRLISAVRAVTGRSQTLPIPEYERLAPERSRATRRKYELRPPHAAVSGASPH